MKYKLPKRPAPVQEANATEMALQPPTEEDLNVLKQLFPTPDKFPYPTPAMIRGVIHSSPALQYRTSKSFDNFFLITTSVDTYSYLYSTGVSVLEKFYEIFYSKGFQALWDYVLANPLTLGNSSISQDFSGFSDDQVFFNSLRNLKERLYISSNPSWGYLRPYLLEKMRALYEDIRNTFPAGDIRRKTLVPKIISQRPTTSRTLGERELSLGSVNAGYKIDVQPDPFTGSKVEVLQLVTWVFTEALTKKLVFVDYFDIVNGDIDAAIAEMRMSDLYRAWARNLSPKEYAQTAEPYQITEGIEELLQGLTPIQKRITT